MPQDILSQLKALCDYYLSNRQRGHTTALMKGGQSTEISKLVLFHEFHEAMELQSQYPIMALTLDNTDSLRGKSLPLLIDNGALTSLFAQAATEIDTLRKQREELLVALTDLAVVSKGELTKLNTLLVDEDLDNEKLRKASEGLLPNTADTLKKAISKAAGVLLKFKK